MPAKTPESEFEQILGEIAKFADGVQIKELSSTPACVNLQRRTLIRRLGKLVQDGRLLAQGQGRGRHYHLPPDPESNARPGAVEDPAKARAPSWLSPVAMEIRIHLRRPLAERTPVGYHPEFLEAYQPNVTAYLPQETRSQLAQAGQVGISELPAGTYLRQVLDRLLIDLSWNSSRLEGNTYSLLETQRLLDLGVAADGKATEEAQMILNHKAAIEMLASNSDALGFNAYTICNLHALLSDNLLTDTAACGKVRSCAVGISGTVFHPLEIPQRIESCFLQILDKANAIQDPFEQAFFAMVHLPYLQPFGNINKRVSRLAANIPLVRHNLCPLSFVDVPQEEYVNGLLGVYELNQVDFLRDVFVWAYMRSAARYSAVRQSLGDPDPFRLQYRLQIGEFVRGVVESGFDKAQAIRWIADRASAEISAVDRHRFVEVVETELCNLHIGSIARFRLLPDVFEGWREGWE